MAPRVLSAQCAGTHAHCRCSVHLVIFDRPSFSSACTHHRPTSSTLRHPPQGKANFFERRVGEYQRAGVAAAGSAPNARDPREYVFTTDVDF